MSQEQGQLDRLESKIDKIDSFITGGSSPEKGLIVRVDRVEQREASRSKWFMVVFGTSVAALIKSFWAAVFHGGT